VNQLVFDGAAPSAHRLARAARRIGALWQLSQQNQVPQHVALRSSAALPLQSGVSQTREMGCLVDAADTIVRSDRAAQRVDPGAQVVPAAMAMSRRSRKCAVEVACAAWWRRLAGHAGLSSVLLQVPDMQQLQADVELSPRSRSSAPRCRRPSATRRPCGRATSAGELEFQRRKTTAYGGNVTPGSTSTRAASASASRSTPILSRASALPAMQPQARAAAPCSATMRSNRGAFASPSLRQTQSPSIAHAASAPRCATRPGAQLHAPAVATTRQAFASM